MLRQLGALGERLGEGRGTAAGTGVPGWRSAGSRPTAPDVIHTLSTQHRTRRKRSTKTNLTKPY